MTNYPTVFGTGGHGASTTYDSLDYYGNVGLGRCPMEGNFITETDVGQIIRVPGTISCLSWA